MTSVVIIMICFFYYLNKRIEGTWISHYSTDLDGTNFRYDGETLTRIKNQKFFSYYYGGKGIPIETNYFDLGKNLKLWPLGIENNSSYEVSEINKDSLILIEYGFDKKTKSIMKKIPDSLKNNTDWNKKLLGKAFEIRIRGDDYTDTIYFDNRFLMSKNQIHPYRKWDSQGWELDKINGFDIMFTGNWTTFILKEDEGKIKFYGFNNKKKLSKTELTEININLLKVKRIVDRIKSEEPK